MAEMSVQGKGALTVPDPMGGVVAVGNGPRVMRWIIDGGVVGLVSGVLNIASSQALLSGEYERAGVIGNVTMVFTVAWFILVLVMLGTRGQTPGAAMMGIRWVKFPSGAQGGGNAIGKYFLEGIIGAVTFGLGPIIIFFASQDEANRHWFDRTTGLISVSTREGRDPVADPESGHRAGAAETPALPLQQPWEAARPGTGGPSSAGAVAGIPPVPLPPSGWEAASRPSTVGAGAGAGAGVGAGVMPPVPLPGGAPLPQSSLPATSPVPAGGAPAPAPTASSVPGSFIGEVPWAPPSSTPEVPSTAPAGPVVPAAAPTTGLPEVPSWLLEEHPAPAAPGLPAQGLPTPGLPASVATSVPVPSPAPVPVGVPEEDLERTVARRPAGSVRLTFDDGTQHHLVGSGVVGRDPVPDAAHAGADRIPVRDPARSISKTHLALTVQAGAVLVEDLHSTNGTRVEGPEGTGTSVLPGAPMLVGPGSTIHFGDRSVVIGG